MPDQPAAAPLNAEFEALLRECLEGLIEPDQVLRGDTDLALLGIDSLTVVRLMVTLEDAFGVTIPDESISFELFSSPGVLWKMISTLMEEHSGR